MNDTTLTTENTTVTIKDGIITIIDGASLITVDRDQNVTVSDNPDVLTRDKVLDMIKAGEKNFSGMDFSGLDLANITFPREADFQGAKFFETNLYGCKFDSANFRDADFRLAVMDDAEFHFCNFTDAVLVGINSYSAEFVSCDLPDDMMDFIS